MAGSSFWANLTSIVSVLVILDHNSFRLILQVHFVIVPLCLHVRPKFEPVIVETKKDRVIVATILLQTTCEKLSVDYNWFAVMYFCTFGTIWDLSMWISCILHCCSRCQSEFVEIRNNGHFSFHLKKKQFAFCCFDLQLAVVVTKTCSTQSYFSSQYGWIIHLCPWETAIWKLCKSDIFSVGS